MVLIKLGLPTGDFHLTYNAPVLAKSAKSLEIFGCFTN